MEDVLLEARRAQNQSQVASFVNSAELNTSGPLMVGAGFSVGWREERPNTPTGQLFGTLIQQH